jgi:hypothetical protein
MNVLQNVFFKKNIGLGEGLTIWVGEWSPNWKEAVVAEVVASPVELVGEVVVTGTNDGIMQMNRVAGQIKRRPKQI